MCELGRNPTSTFCSFRNCSVHTGLLLRWKGMFSWVWLLFALYSTSALSCYLSVCLSLSCYSHFAFWLSLFLFTNLKPCILNTCSFSLSSETLIPHSFFLQRKMNLWRDKNNEGADPSLLNKRIKFIKVWPEFGTLATNHFAEMTNQTNKGSTNMAIKLQCVKMINK